MALGCRSAQMRAALGTGKSLSFVRRHKENLCPIWSSLKIARALAAQQAFRFGQSRSGASFATALSARVCTKRLSRMSLLFGLARSVCARKMKWSSNGIGCRLHCSEQHAAHAALLCWVTCGLHHSSGCSSSPLAISSLVQVFRNRLCTSSITGESKRPPTRCQRSVGIGVASWQSQGLSYRGQCAVPPKISVHGTACGSP